MSTVKILAPEMLLAGKEMDLKQNWAVLVEGTKIREVAPRENLVQKYPEVSVEEYPGGCMLPGLIDCHVHLMLYCGVVTLLMVVQIGSQLAGVGTVLENIAGVPYRWGVVIAVLIIMFYLCVGGTYAHIYTNIVQGAMVVAAGVVIFISGFFVFGNIFTEVPALLAAEDPLLVAPTSSYNGAYGSFWAIFGIYITHIWWTLNPHQINKFQYLKSEKDIRKFIIFTCIFIFVGALTQVSGLYTRALVGASLDKIDNAAVTYLSLVFPKAFAALLTVIILAAVMSTTDGIMVYLATVLGNELYMNGLVKSKESRGVKIDWAREEKIALRICQFGVIAVGLIGLPIALKRPASISTLLWVGNGGVMGGVAGPIILGLFNKRTGKAAAIAGSVCGFAGFMVLYFGGIVTAVYLANALGGLISVGVTFVCTYIFKPMPEEKIDFLFGEVEETPL